MKLVVFALVLTACVTSDPVRVEKPTPERPVEKTIEVKADPKVEKQVEKSAEPKKVAPVYDEAAIGADQISAALAKAKRENRRVLVQWGANWCGWCKLLAALEKSDKDIAKEILYEYDVVKIDIGRFDKHMDLAEKYGADLKANGVPFLTVLDGDGKVVASQETGSLELATKVEGKSGHDPKKVLDFLTTHQAAALDAQRVYDSALATAKSESELAFLHFGAPWCHWCHMLEDWMAQPDIAAVLARAFVDVKIDTDRMIGGDDMLKRIRPVNGGIPWFAFLDADGKVVVDSNGPKGNIGFPGAPDEIAHFKSMLEKSNSKLTSDDITLLVNSLAPKKETK